MTCQTTCLYPAVARLGALSSKSNKVQTTRKVVAALTTMTAATRTITSEEESSISLKISTEDLALRLIMSMTTTTWASWTARKARQKTQISRITFQISATKRRMITSSFPKVASLIWWSIRVLGTMSRWRWLMRMSAGTSTSPKKTIPMMRTRQTMGRLFKLRTKIANQTTRRY